MIMKNRSAGLSVRTAENDWSFGRALTGWTRKPWKEKASVIPLIWFVRSALIFVRYAEQTINMLSAKS